MDSVLFLIPNSSPPVREQVSGAYRYIETSGWNVQLIEVLIESIDFRNLLRKWNPIGCLVNRSLTSARLPKRMFARIPTVYVDQDRSVPNEREWCVFHNSVATTRAAFDELSRLHPVHYAFIRDARVPFWDAERKRAFAELAAGSGAGCTVLETDTDLMERLARLPKPCGLLGSTDLCARKAIDAANKAGIPVPQELQVIGIGNDTFVCEHSRPTISSVHPDFEGCGYLAMATLYRIISGTAATPRAISYGPKETIRRSSTRILGTYDARVIRALDFITARFADPNLRSETIASAMGCSRSLADLKFRQITGRTIRESIQSTRMDMAKRLLSGSSHDLKAIPSLCGYRSETTFMRTFKATTGLTMSDWRNTRLVTCPLPSATEQGQANQRTGTESTPDPGRRSSRSCAPRPVAAHRTAGG